MTDQEKLEFKEKYQNNPVAFLEDCIGVKLLPYQKAMINGVNKIGDVRYTYVQSRINQKRWLANLQLTYMKAMEMDFELWTKEGIEVYEKGVLVKTLKHIRI
jgi:hypothetical protein